MIERSDRNRRFFRHLIEVMGLGSAAGLVLTSAACGPNVVLDKPATSGAGGSSTSAHTASSGFGQGGYGGYSYGDAGGYYGDTGGVYYGQGGYGGYGYGGSGYAVTVGVGGYNGAGGYGVSTAVSVGAGGSIGVGGGCTVTVPAGSQVVQGCISASTGCPGPGDAALFGLLADQLGLCPQTGGNVCCGGPSLIEVDCGPEYTPAGTCCYYGLEAPGTTCSSSGRPFTVEGQARTAPVRARGDWAAVARGVPDVGALDPVTRRALAEGWSRDARYEHASVASFARLALELLAVGAPAELLRDAQRAMGDEIRHAEVCFALAGAYAGAAEGPGALPFEGALGRASLAEVAAAAVREGCIGETLAALAAAEARDLAEDPAVRAALDVIAEDEAAHAAMAWRLVAWAHRAGGDEVRAAIAAAFAEDVDLGDVAGTGEGGGVDVEAFHAHGRLLPSEIRAHAERALAEVVRPSAAALLGA